MALIRCTKIIDGTIPIPALLYDDEDELASQNNVGIYDGQQKAPEHQTGTVHVSTHRLFYVDAQKPSINSFSVSLSTVSKTDYYAGLFKSSPKVTLYLTPPIISVSSPETTSNDTDLDSETWECHVCSYRNPPGLSPTAARICALCGVPRNTLPAPPPSPTKSITARSFSPSLLQSLSSSLPTSPATSFSARSNPAPESDDGQSVPCSACTFLNHPSLHTCEICGTSLPRRRPSFVNHQGVSPPQLTPSRLGKSAPPTRAPSPDLEDDVQVERGTNWTIKLSFRKGGDKSFYAVLRRSLMAKAWESKGIGVRSASGATSSEPAGSRSGINGILRSVETSVQSTSTDMSDALQDLEALMVKARDMVKLAAELNERLTAVTASNSLVPSLATGQSLSASTEPEEATFIRSSLSQLGLQMENAPVTQDMIKDEQQWMEELAKELAWVLQGGRGKKGAVRVGMMRDRGIIALDEVWGGWNRARGVALIPPSTFLSVLPHLPYYTDPPIRLRTFPSGLKVLHTPPYTHAAFIARLIGILTLSGPQTALGIAREEKLTISMTMEMIGVAELEGHVCRDDGSSMITGGSSGVGIDVRWWKNVFKDYEWDGQD